MSEKPSPVDVYLNTQPPAERAALERVRKIIHATVPGVQECLSYGMPAFKLEKPIAGFLTAKDHLSYFPMSGWVVDQLADELSGYRTSKGTVRFTLKKPLPVALIKKLLKVRLHELKNGRSAYGTKKQYDN